jgi:hypothetical protein
MKNQKLFSVVGIEALSPLRGKLQITNPKLQTKRCPSG